MESVDEVLHRIAPKFRQLLKVECLLPYLEKRMSRFLTPEEHGKLRAHDSDEEAGFSFYEILRRKGGPKPLLKALYLSLMDSYEEELVVPHYDLAQHIARTGMFVGIYHSLMDIFHNHMHSTKIVNPHAFNCRIRNHGKNDQRVVSCNPSSVQAMNKTTRLIYSLAMWHTDARNWNFC